MRKVVLCLVASTALALSSAADAAINITGMSGLTSTPGVTNGSTEDYVDFSANTEPSGDFTSWFTFHNDTPGLYSIKVTTSTIGAMLSSLVLSNNDGSTPLFSYVGPPSDTLSLITDDLGAGDYRLTFGGNSGNNASVVSGNFTFYVQAVPEPATWALMLLGFGGIGIAMRRRRLPALAQIA